jgi:hypothetical protein
VQAEKNSRKAIIHLNHAHPLMSLGLLAEWDAWVPGDTWHALSLPSRQRGAPRVLLSNFQWLSTLET